MYIGLDSGRTATNNDNPPVNHNPWNKDFTFTS